MPPILRFDVQGPDFQGQVDLPAFEMVRIGRESGCELQLPSPSVSRRHLSVAWGLEGLTVTDTSMNGTLVDGLLLRRGTRAVGAHVAVLQVGHYEVQVTALQDDGEAPRDVPPGEPNSAATLAPREPSSEPGPSVQVRRQIHRRLLENLDLAGLGNTAIDSIAMRPQVVAALRRIVSETLAENANGTTPSDEVRERLVQELTDEALGLGPLERLLADVDVSEIMVVDAHTIFVERAGKLELSELRFTDDNSVRAVIERIVTPLGRRIDESTPLVDARLRDGSRVNAVIPPLALRGPCITIRKFAKDPLRMADLIRFESLSPSMARFLERSVQAKRNIVISGGTGSGKTTLLNVLSASIPVHERVVTIEDAAELQLVQPHVVSLEARPPNLEGKGEYSIRDLVKNALRMRPDRIVVGECRGGEALDMLQAMNTGHEGSLTTTHANSAREAVARIETLCLMAGLALPVRAIRQQIASSIHLFVQQTRFSDGKRRVQSITEVLGLDDDGEIELQEIYVYRPSRGAFLATGYLPTFVDRLIDEGLLGDGALL